MLSEKYRPQEWAAFIGQPVIAEIQAACGDSWLFDGGGERWLFESDGIAGCGKTSAAYVTARALGCAEYDCIKIDSRSTTVADLRTLEGSMRTYGFGPSGRKAYIIDEIQHLSRDCLRMLLGLLESIPSHVILIGTTTSNTWADEIDGLFSRWRRFIFRKPNAKAVAAHLERIASEVPDITVPDGFNFLGYVQGKLRHTPMDGNNIRAAIDGLPDALRRFGGVSVAA